MASPFAGRTAGIREVFPSGDRILLVTDRRESLLWDVVRAQVILRFGAEDRGAPCGSWSGDGRRIISFGNDQTIFVWDAHSGQLVRQLRIDVKEIIAAELSGDGTLAAVGEDDTIRIWNLETGVESSPFIGHEGLISTLLFADQGRTLFSGDIQGNLRRWSLAHHREVWAVP